MKLTSPRASNWVDRGEDPDVRLCQSLAVYLGQDPGDASHLREHAVAVLGMVMADATEVQVAAYLGDLDREFDRTPPPPGHRRTTAVALWHIAKAALVRDAANRLLEGPLPQPTSQVEPLSSWLRERLLEEGDDSVGGTIEPE